MKVQRLRYRGALVSPWPIEWLFSLIEEFMLAANEAVAAHLEERGVPCIYRVHEPPDPAKLEALADFVAGLGLDLPGSTGRRARNPPNNGEVSALQKRQPWTIGT